MPNPPPPPYDLVHDCFLFNQRESMGGGRCLQFFSQNINEISLILFTQGETRRPLVNMAVGFNIIWEFWKMQCSTSDLLNRKCWEWGTTIFFNESSGEFWSSLKVMKFCVVLRLGHRLSPKLCLWGCAASLVKVDLVEVKSPLQLENTSQGTWQGLCSPYSYNRQARDMLYFSNSSFCSKSLHHSLWLLSQTEDQSICVFMSYSKG